jgi:hypothetical protein
MDIYMFNLTSQTEVSLPLPEQACFSPAICEDYVVYIGEEYWDSGYGIFYHSYVSGYNLSTGVKSTLFSGKPDGVPDYEDRELSSPVIDGSLVAWTQFSGGWNVLVKNLTDGTVWGSGSGDQLGPDVSKTFVVYQGNVGTWDIFVHDFNKNLLVDLTINSANQGSPVISTGYANFVVYMDIRNGNWDIYLSTFWYGSTGGWDSIPDPPITPSRIINNLQQVNGSIADLSTSAFAGANDKVKENRRNALINQFNSAIASIKTVANTPDISVRSRGFQTAIDQLNELISKVDGWSLRHSADVAGSGFTPDWITAPVYLDQMVRSCRDDLQTLLNGLS